MDPRDELQGIALDAVVVVVGIALPLALQVVEAAAVIDVARVELAAQIRDGLDRHPEIPVLDQPIALAGEGFWNGRRTPGRFIERLGCLGSRCRTGPEEQEEQGEDGSHHHHEKPEG